MGTPYTPLWTTPSTPGLLSNKVGGTHESMTVHCTNPAGSADSVGSLRVVATRNSDGVTLWDSGILGGPTTVVPTNFCNSDCGGIIGVTSANSLVTVAGLTGTNPGGDAVSVPTMGWNAGGGQRQIGAVRAAILQNAIGRTMHATCVATLPSGVQYIYMLGGEDVMPGGGLASPAGTFNGGASGGNFVLYAQLNPDGTTSGWKAGNSTGFNTPGNNQTVCMGSAVSYADSTGQVYIAFLGGVGANNGSLTANVSNIVQWAPVNADGTLGNWTNTGTLVTGVYGAAGCVLGTTVYLLGGYASSTAGSAAQNISQAGPIQVGGSCTISTQNSSVLATAVGNAAFAAYQSPNSANGVVVLMGGRTTNNGAAITTTTYWVTDLTGSHGTLATSLPVATTNASGCATQIGTGELNASGVLAFIQYFMWFQSGPAGSLYVSQITFTGDVPAISGSWAHGIGSALAAITGGSVATNTDGSQDLTFTHAGFGTAGGNTANGDTVTYSVQVSSTQTGAGSPVSYTAIKYGAAPTVSALGAALYSGAVQSLSACPTINFTYTAGTGGGPLSQWQAQLLDATSGALILDTGLQYQAFTTSYQFALPPLPSLAPATNYTLKVFNVASTDQPYPGSTNQAAVANQTVTFSGSSPSARPQIVGCVADNVNGCINVSISSGGITNLGLVRIWYRTNGTFNLLTANQASLEGNSTNGWVAGANSAIAASTLAALDGTHSLLIAASAAGTASAKTVDTNGSALFWAPVTPGQTFTAIASFITGYTQRQVQVAINWIDESGAVISTSTGTAVNEIPLNLMSTNQSTLELGATTGWGNTTNCAITASDTVSLNGQYSLALTSTAAGNMSATTTQGTSGFLVVPGLSYTAMGWARAATVGRNCQLNIDWYKNDGTLLSSSTGSTAADTTTGWTQLPSLVVTAPATAAFADVQILVNSTGAGGEVHFGDQFQFSQGTVAAWLRGGSIAFAQATVTAVAPANAAFAQVVPQILSCAAPASPPTGLTVTAMGTTGATTYGYRVSATTYWGQTLACTEVTIANGNASLTAGNFNRLRWAPVAGATGYTVYGRTAGAELKMTTVGFNVLSFDDTGTLTPSGALPGVNNGFEGHLVDCAGLAYGTGTAWSAGTGGNWQLLKNLVPSGNGTDTFSAYDQIPLGQQVDFVVSAVTTNGFESGISGASSATITPVTNDTQRSYSGMLHVAGLGPTLHAPILYDSTPTYDVKLSRSSTVMYATTAPSVRYGLANYQQVTVPLWLPTVAAQKTLEQVLGYAQTNGLPVYWRDSFGVVLVCSVDERSYQYEPPTFEKGSLKLEQVAFTFAP